MPQSPKALVEPALLAWARTSAGLSVEDAAARLKVKNPEDRLRAWEDPDDEAGPTVSQLRTLAKVYRRPLAVFYLAEPPLDFQPVRDYRRLADAAAVDDVSIELRSELARVIDMQETAVGLLTEDPAEDHPEFPLRVTRRSSAEIVGAEIREALGITLATQTGWSDPYTALREWRTAVEGLGVLVTQASGVALSEMRGFSIDHDRLPLICINSTDQPNGRIFTLMHELAHISLRQGGLCEWQAGRQSPENEQIETFCNRVAGGVLVPMDALLELPIVREAGSGTRSWSNEEIEAIARHFAVSRHVILRRLLIAERASQSFYRSKERELLAEYRAQAEAPSRPIVVEYSKRVANRLGHSFIALVLSGYYEQRLTLADASRLIGVRVKHLPAIEQEVMGWSHIRTTGP